MPGACRGRPGPPRPISFASSSPPQLWSSCNPSKIRWVSYAWVGNCDQRVANASESSSFTFSANGRPAFLWKRWHKFCFLDTKMLPKIFRSMCPRCAQQFCRVLPRTRNIVGHNVAATMCPRFAATLPWSTFRRQPSDRSRIGRACVWIARITLTNFQSLATQRPFTNRPCLCVNSRDYSYQLSVLGNPATVHE